MGSKNLGGGGPGRPSSFDPVGFLHLEFFLQQRLGLIKHWTLDATFSPSDISPHVRTPSSHPRVRGNLQIRSERLNAAVHRENRVRWADERWERAGGPPSQRGPATRARERQMGGSRILVAKGTAMPGDCNFWADVRCVKRTCCVIYIYICLSKLVAMENILFLCDLRPLIWADVG